MKNLHIELGSCVKVFAKSASCINCADICPEGAISFADNIPQVSSHCTECGLCLGSCPTDAISLKNFDTLETIFGTLEKKQHSLTCGIDVPCLGVYHTEHLISMTLLSDTDTFALQHCELCADAITQRAAEANLFLTELQSNKLITLSSAPTLEVDEPEVDQTANRRAFLERLTLKGAIKSKMEFEKEVEAEEMRQISAADSANIRKKELPNRRKLLYMALKRAPDKEIDSTLPSDNLTFISQKAVNSDCDNCSMCYRICPTGALQSDKRQTKIEFDMLACVKCKLCHDVCTPNAITLEPINMAKFFKPKIDGLIKFNVVRCNECANFFTYQGGEMICPRCRLEEEEAKELWGIR